jgi:glycine/D-amino acid oxidase-like deaminating enzyme
MEKILIIGQGVAGTLLSFTLYQAGIDHWVMDDAHRGASSLRAAGIVNPITGRRFVKSWEFDRFYAQAKVQYAALQALLGGQYWEERQVAMLFHQVKQLNDWSLRSSQADLLPFVVEDVDLAPFQSAFEGVQGAALFRQAARVNLSKLLSDYAQFLRQQKRLLEGAFVHGDLRQAPQGGWLYGQEVWDKIIFCEGHRAAAENPFFADLPFNLAKGEMLLLRIPDFPQAQTMCKYGNLFFVHLGDAVYWVGSSYLWQFEDDQPTEAERLRLLAEVKACLRCPFELVDHQAGIRPTIKDRRPRLLAHPSLKGLYAFNGLGTKGSYLAPLLAQEMLKIIQGETSHFELKNVNS